MAAPTIRCAHCKEPIAGIQYATENEGQSIVFAHQFCHEQVMNPKACPTCQSPLTLPAFMHIRPEGYVCEACRLYYIEEPSGLKPIARIF